MTLEENIQRLIADLEQQIAEQRRMASKASAKADHLLEMKRLLENALDSSGESKPPTIGQVQALFKDVSPKPAAVDPKTCYHVYPQGIGDIRCIYCGALPFQYS